MNAPLSRWSPENYDYDIMVTRPIGKGRGLGFDNSEEHSVLGDSDITPRIIDRMVNMLCFFVQENIITEDDLIKRLNLNKNISGQDKFIPYPQYSDLEALYLSQIRVINNLRKENDMNSMSYYNSQREVDGLREAKEREDEVGSTLRWFLENSTSQMVSDEEFGYLVRINMIDPLLVGDELKNMRSKTRDDVKKIVNERIICDLFEIEFFLEKFFFRKTRSIADKLFDVEL